MKKVYLLIITLLVLLVLYRFLFSDYSLNAESFKSIYKQEAATIENYQKECSAELDQNLIFPSGTIKKAVLINGFFSIDKRLNDSNTNRILKILNDTASYEWGEICCFNSGRKIIFYDSKGNPVGITVLDKEYENLTHSSPYLKKMKWGTLKSEPHKELQKLLSTN